MNLKFQLEEITGTRQVKRVLSLTCLTIILTLAVISLLPKLTHAVPYGSGIYGAGPYGGFVCPAGRGNPDINQNSRVDVYDLSIMTSRWNTADLAADLNCDNYVDGIDFSILLINWQGSP